MNSPTALRVSMCEELGKHGWLEPVSWRGLQGAVSPLLPPGMTWEGGRMAVYEEEPGERRDLLSPWNYLPSSEDWHQRRG